MKKIDKDRRFELILKEVRSLREKIFGKLTERFLKKMNAFSPQVGFINKKNRIPPPLEKWFKIELNADYVTIKASPPENDPWEQSFTWAAVTRVCFKNEEGLVSDAFYIFTTLRKESFIIPIDANGGKEFVQEIRKRGLFPEDITITAFASTEGGVYCWPPIENKGS